MWTKLKRLVVNDILLSSLSFYPLCVFSVYGCKTITLELPRNGSSSIPQILTEYNREFNPVVCCLFETRISGMHTDDVISKLRFPYSC